MISGDRRTDVTRMAGVLMHLAVTTHSDGPEEPPSLRWISSAPEEECPSCDGAAITVRSHADACGCAVCDILAIATKLSTSRRRMRNMQRSYYRNGPLKSGKHGVIT